MALTERGCNGRWCDCVPARNCLRRKRFRERWMDKAAAMGWIQAFAGLPQCVRLSNYQAGFNPFGTSGHLAVLNAMTGTLLVAVRVEEAQPAGILSKGKSETWRVGMPTPVLGYPDTFGSNKTVATTFFSEQELERLLGIWKTQGNSLVPSSKELKMDAGDGEKL